jgi:hypothetical protein
MAVPMVFFTVYRACCLSFGLLRVSKVSYSSGYHRVDLLHLAAAVVNQCSNSCLRFVLLQLSLTRCAGSFTDLNVDLFDVVKAVLAWILIASVCG